MKEFEMKQHFLHAAIVMTILLPTVSALAQTPADADKQHTQSLSHGDVAKQPAQSLSHEDVQKQKAQSLAHSDVTKQKAQSLAHADITKQKAQSFSHSDPGLSDGLTKQH